MSHPRSVVFHACATVLAACILPALPAMATPPVTTVVNYNQRLFRSTGELTVAVIRSTDTSTTKLPITMSQIKNEISIAGRIVRTDSRGKSWLKIVSTQTNGTYTGAKVWDIVTVHPYGSGHSQSGDGHTEINGYGAWMHEFGHLLGTNEANTDINGVFRGDGDTSSFEGKYAADCFNAPQLHWMGWTDTEDCVRLNDLISDGQSIEVPIRPIDNNSVTSTTVPMAYEYDIPGTTTREWISMPKSIKTNNGIEGGDIFVYFADNGSKMHANWWMPTDVVGRLGITTTTNQVIENLVIKPISYVGKIVNYKNPLTGKIVKEEQVTQEVLQISLAAP